MDKDTLHRLWQQALMQSVADGEDFTRYQFAANFAALVEAHLKSQGYRQCAKGQKTTQFCGMVEQAVKAEREQCAKVCEEDGLLWGQRYATAIRSRNDTV